MSRQTRTKARGLPAGRMRAMRIHRLGPLADEPPGLQLDCIEIPRPGQGEVLIRVHCCGVCHTELDEIEDRAPPASLPMTPGHEAVGVVVAEGPDCSMDLPGTTVGVAWIHSACGHCAFCQRGLENLCPDFQACGRDRPGGYAEYMTAPERFVHPIPAGLAPEHAAPLLCAGAVGYRALRLTALVDGAPLGLTGFGASGQLVLPMARHLYPDSPILVFARSARERDIALQLGAAWAGDTRTAPPQPLRAIIDTTPAWLPVLAALEALEPGGRLVINAIRKESGDRQLLADLDYARHLWLEKSIQSTANVTRADVRDTLQLAARIALTPRIAEYPLERAMDALRAVRSGDIRAACVLRIQFTG
jgi:propanol-preferring alcohol dehydrogenase